MPRYVGVATDHYNSLILISYCSFITYKLLPEKGKEVRKQVGRKKESLFKEGKEKKTRNGGKQCDPKLNKVA